jgi:hypothetical protein
MNTHTETWAVPRWFSRMLLVLAVAASMLVVAIPRASAVTTVPMHCGGGVCYWGYNYLSSSGIFGIYGTWNYWQDQYVDKTSGGGIYHGFNTSGSTNNCYAGMSGAWTFYDTPNHIGTGCGGYLQPFAQYGWGTQSYLYMDDYS